MDVLLWRKAHVDLCLTTYLPLILKDFANKLNSKILDYKITFVNLNQSTKGFHFSNVLNISFYLDGYKEKIHFKFPIPNENDLFVINDSYRILTMELLDGLVSVRNIKNFIDIRWQFLTTAIVCFKGNSVRIFNDNIHFYRLLTHFFTTDELRKYNMFFKITTGNEIIENMYPTKITDKYTLWSQLPVEKMNNFIKSVYLSFNKNNILQLNNPIPEKIITALNSVIDPITKYIYKINDWKDVLEYTLRSLYNQKDKDLVGTNLAFKRVRSLESVLVLLYKKLNEIVKNQKKQTQIRISSDFILKSIFTSSSIQPMFEYVELINLFKELSLKYKVIMLIDFLPYDLRDVHISYMYNIDPFHTPDDEKIGKIQYLSIHCKLDEFGKFIL